MFVLLLALMLAGCGDDDESDAPERKPGAARLGKPTKNKGENPRQLNQYLEEEQSFEQEPTEAEPATLVSENEANDPTVDATAQYLTATIKHADTIWTNWFTQNGYREPFVGYEIIKPGKPYRMTCDGGRTLPSDFPNAYYCPSDRNQKDTGVVILPVQTMTKMWTGNIFGHQVDNLKRTGDFAAGMITAHEFGHHIQDEIAQQSKSPDPGKPYQELIADCFAGVWAFSVFLDNYLSDGDVDEAVNALEVIGDPGSHGTGPQRQNAFLIGYTGTTDAPGGGVPAKCMQNYWVSS